MKTKIIIGLGIIVLILSGIFTFSISKYYQNNIQNKQEEIKINKNNNKKDGKQETNSQSEEMKQQLKDEQATNREKEINADKKTEIKSALDRFLLSIYNPPYAWRYGPYRDKDFDYYQKAGFDNFLWARDEAKLMEKIHKYHFKYFLNVRALFPEEGPGNIDYLRGVKNPDEDNETYNVRPAVVPEVLLKKLDILVDKYKDDPDLIGYWICDEPFPSAYKNIAKVIERIRQKDPKHYSLVNIGDNEYTTEKNIDKFLEITKAKVLCFDRYNFFNGFDRNRQFLQLLGMIRQKALEYNIPFYGFVQAVGTNGTSASELDWRTPNLNEMRWLAYHMLTYGAKGLLWFHWDAEDWGVIQNPARNKIYINLQKVNKEIKSLGDMMANLKTVDVYQVKGEKIIGQRKEGDKKFIYPVDNKTSLTVGMFSRNDGKEYFMLTNTSFRTSVNSEIKILKAINGLEAFNIETKKWETININANSDNTTFMLELEKGSGKLFREKMEF